LFAESVDKDEYIVVAVSVFVERTEIDSNVLPWARRNRERMQKARLLITGY
jgi:hypothetical protein